MVRTLTDYKDERQRFTEKFPVVNNPSALKPGQTGKWLTSEGWKYGIREQNNRVRIFATEDAVAYLVSAASSGGGSALPVDSYVWNDGTPVLTAGGEVYTVKP